MCRHTPACRTGLSAILAPVPEQLLIDGGPTARLLGEPPQGTRHAIRFAVRADTDAPVVVKIEQIPGALAREHAALAWLAAAGGGMAPRVVAFGPAVLGRDRVTCLVTDRVVGEPPTTDAGWRRMGAALAAVAGVLRPSDRLPVIDSDKFSRAHVARIDELGGRLQSFVSEISDWTELSHRALPASAPLVLTHGDPGPGNYLDSDTSGTLIDWEEAHVAPLGLDLGRLIFIALLGSGPKGYIAREHRSRAASGAAGYLAAVRPKWSPSSEELRWWVSVAAIQFIHRRWERGGRPAPWEHAAELLAPALAMSP